MFPMRLGWENKTERRRIVDKRKVKLLIGCGVFMAMCATTIVINVIRKKRKPRAIIYERHEPFSIIVSQETWDESMMPKGKRSPKGVLYIPEK